MMWILIYFLFFNSATVAGSPMYYGELKVTHKLDNRGRIGIVWNPANHRIVTVYRNSPAYTAGLHIGDRINHYNDVHIRGPVGTKVNLTIQRGDKILYFTITRVPWDSVDTKYDVNKEINRQESSDYETTHQENS